MSTLKTVDSGWVRNSFEYENDWRQNLKGLGSRGEGGGRKYSRTE